MPKVQLRYCCNYSEKLIRALEERGIQCEVSDLPTIGMHTIVFKMCDDQPDDSRLKTLADKSCITCFKSLVFSKSEMNSAEWYSMWCDNMKIEEDGDHSAYEYSCEYAANRAQHRKQIRSFVLKKPIKWSANRFFVAMLGDGRTLLAKTQTKDILNNSGIKGICWLDVLDKCGERFEDTFQLTAETVIPTEALILNEMEYRKKICCEICGKEQYSIDGSFRLRVRKSALNPAIDIVRTEAIFGDGFANPAILVSKRFYETVVRNGLGKTIHFEPIILEE